MPNEVISSFDDDRVYNQVMEFLQRYWLHLLTSLILGLGLLLAVLYWQHRQHQQSLQASDIYDQALIVANDGDLSRAIKLLSHHKIQRTGYASMAAVIKARLQTDLMKFEKQDPPQKPYYMQVEDNSRVDPRFVNLARLKYVIYEYENENIDKLLEVLGRNLSGDPWTYMSMEAQAMLELKKDQKDRAENLYRSLLQKNKLVPVGVLARCEAMLEWIAIKSHH